MNVTFEIDPNLPLYIGELRPLIRRQLVTQMQMAQVMEKANRNRQPVIPVEQLNRELERRESEQKFIQKRKKNKLMPRR